MKEIDPGLSAGDLTLNLTATRTDIYGEYEVQPGDTLSAIAKQVTRASSATSKSLRPTRISSMTQTEYNPARSS